MAILFGTTADGESLPVQVNEFGQLVAKGLPGEKGDQGPPGPEGPVGNVAFASGTFSPVFSSSDPEASGFIEYSYQDGYWYRFGPLLTVQIYLITESVVLTNPRGYLEVSGFPAEATFAQPNRACAYNPFSLSTLITSAKGRAHGGRITYSFNKNSLRPGGYWGDALFDCMFADLDSENGGSNSVIAAFSGLARDAVRSVPTELDELM